ncbi:MAG: hypothetical protein M1824_000279 [Vezdaea acicularis]|nr:MAG: hypothetical protein M1824_000279 [Vezdaea acicularis]
MAAGMKAWVLTGTNGFDDLQLQETKLRSLRDLDVLVKLKAGSLNYRDVAMAMNTYPVPYKLGIPVGSDGAGEVIAVGSHVSEFEKGDAVLTTFTQDQVSGHPTQKIMESQLGALRDGVFTQYGIFPQHGLVRMPKSVNWREGSTLSCAAVTAWNALFGEWTTKPEDYILIQGTGGVSLFGLQVSRSPLRADTSPPLRTMLISSAALQFAAAAGATVIATTSSDDKVQMLKDLGAKHVINYKKDPTWGKAAKELTPDNEGFDNIFDMGGASTLRQSLECVKLGGHISLIGFLGGFESKDVPSIQEILLHQCIVRGISVGSREQFQAMNKFIDEKAIKPVLDSTVFDFEHLRDAYQHLWDQKHIGKIVVDIN